MPPLSDRLTGLALVLVTVLMALSEWTGLPHAATLAGGLSVVALALMTPRVKPSRQVFVAVGLGLAAVAVALRPDAGQMLNRALQSAAFIAAFFTGLTTLRHAAESAPSIRASGRFLATQPPGRRYVALTLGGQIFAMLLNYGSITLLGSLAVASTDESASEEVRAIRKRRMLLAIQRGFVSTLPWSPLAFSIAISTALVPGASWAAAVPRCLVSGAIIAVLGWALDTLYKPRLTGPRPQPRPPEGRWASLRPLLILLAILLSAVLVLHRVSHVRIVGIVVVVVPLISAAWVTMQDGLAGLRRRAVGYATRDLLGYRGELVLLMMAGFIGTLGAALAVPVVARSGLSLDGVPAAALLVALVWLIPLAGQLGMNPILSVSVIAPLLPPPHVMGVAPADVVVAITGGWALAGASSPFTATTMMVGVFGGVSAGQVGRGWNGLFTLLAATLLSGWVLILVLA